MEPGVAPGNPFALAEADRWWATLLILRLTRGQNAVFALVFPNICVSTRYIWMKIAFSGSSCISRIHYQLIL